MVVAVIWWQWRSFSGGGGEHLVAAVGIESNKNH